MSEKEKEVLNESGLLKCENCGAEMIERDSSSHELYCLNCGKPVQEIGKTSGQKDSQRTKRY